MHGVVIMKRMTDAVAQTNRERWTALVEADVVWSRPRVDMTPETARARLNQDADMDKLLDIDVAGLKVLCLGGGGGQQSVSFSLLGARVTVVDLTPAQLEKDRAMAAHYGYNLRVVEADMRDLSALDDDGFDLVWQPYSINFVPDPLVVFAEVERVLRPNGRYYLQFANPHGSVEDKDWTGEGYPIKLPYIQGLEYPHDLRIWDVDDSDGHTQKVLGPREFIHTWETIVNGLARHGFVIYGMHGGPHGDASAEPGTWDHMLTYLPLWPGFYCRRC